MFTYSTVTFKNSILYLNTAPAAAPKPENFMKNDQWTYTSLTLSNDDEIY